MSNCPVGSYFIKVVANSVDLDQIAPRSQSVFTGGSSLSLLEPDFMSQFNSD